MLGPTVAGETPRELRQEYATVVKRRIEALEIFLDPGSCTASALMRRSGEQGSVPT